MKSKHKWLTVLIIIVALINIWHFGGELWHKQFNNDTATTQTSKKANEKKPFNSAKTAPKKKSTGINQTSNSDADNQNKVIDGNDQNHAENQTNSTENNWDLTKANATDFGLEDVQTVQSNVGTIYSSKYLPDQGMSYTWKNHFGTFIRVDDETSHITSVYLYDPNDSNSLGDVLYQGQINYQRAAESSNYNNY